MHVYSPPDPRFSFFNYSFFNLEVDVYKRQVWVLFALVFSVSVAAQKTVVKGNILDKDNLPIIGANILEKGTSNGTISDVDGNFTLSITNPKATLLITYIGYKNVEMPASANMKIVMTEDSEMLEDVVVIGYGSVKKSDATGSVSYTHLIGAIAIRWIS